MKRITNSTAYFFRNLGFIFLLVYIPYSASSQTISISGTNWVVPISPITEAGSNYVGTYESPSNQILLTASVPLLLGSGKVSVHYEPNPTWHNALALSVKRTGNGTTLCLLCTITDGTNYQPITTVDTELFHINAILALASYSNIPIQLSLTGVSVTIPAATYQSKIVFTIGPL